MDYTYIDYHTEMIEHYYRAGAFHTVRDPQEDATSGNHHVLNATHHLVLKKLINGNGVIKNTLLRQEALPAFNFIEATRNKYEWFDRHPAKMGDRQAHDDNIGIITSSKILTLPFATDIYEHGDKWTKGTFEVKGIKLPILLKWYYTNLDDLPAIRFNAWHGRFPWLIALYKVGAGYEPGLLGSLAYAVYLLEDVYFNKDKTDTSGKILKWLMNDSLRGESKIIDWAIDKWEAYIKEMYPNGYMGEVLGIYHGEDHPFAKAMYGRI
jgi:hypothetical protein